MIALLCAFVRAPLGLSAPGGEPVHEDPPGAQ